MVKSYEVPKICNHHSGEILPVNDDIGSTNPFFIFIKIFKQAHVVIISPVDLVAFYVKQIICEICLLVHRFSFI